MKQLSITVLLALLAFTSMSHADDHGDKFAATKAKLEAALKSDIRSEAEVARDKNRKPIETLEFFELRDDMTIVELVPGGGWYTKLLAPTVAEKGNYYAAFGTNRIKESLSDAAGFEKMNIVAEDGRLYREEGSRFYSLEVPKDGLGVKRADMVLTFRNYHNFGEQGRAAMNELAFDALKKGGIYAVVDHTARHMEAPSNENRRRFDPVLAIKEIQAAGFEFVDYSTLHHKLDDQLLYEVGRRSVSGNTDRWTLKFRKP
jgi:predicted methyltransferase